MTTSDNKIIKGNNTSPIKTEYQKKIIHIDKGNKLNIIKSQTQYPLNNKNFMKKMKMIILKK